MGHYTTSTDYDCTESGNQHTWSDLKVKDTSFDVIGKGDSIYLHIEWTQYRSCYTEMEYHGGRGIGMTSGKVCKQRRDVERNSMNVPISLLSAISERSVDVL